MGLQPEKFPETHFCQGQEMKHVTHDILRVFEHVRHIALIVTDVEGGVVQAVAEKCEEDVGYGVLYDLDYHFHQTFLYPYSYIFHTMIWNEIKTFSHKMYTS